MKIIEEGIKYAQFVNMFSSNAASHSGDGSADISIRSSDDNIKVHGQECTPD